jgi:hypothetical protein
MATLRLGGHDRRLPKRALCFQWPARALFGTDHFDETRNPATMAHLLGRPIRRLDPTRPWLAGRKVRRQIPHRMESREYAAERNKYARDGLWKIGGSRQVVYAKKSLSTAERLTAIRRLTGD